VLGDLAMCSLHCAFRRCGS